MPLGRQDDTVRHQDRGKWALVVLRHASSPVVEEQATC
jgi:hypothetical protein